MTDKVKTVIECYFLLPDFKSRGHPSDDPLHETAEPTHLKWNQVV